MNHYLPESYKVKAILFHKGDVGKSSHKVIDWRAFLDLVYGPEYQEKIKSRKLLGLLTHSGRKSARSGIIPHADTVMIDKDLCNVLIGVDDDDTCVYGYFDLVPGEAADRFVKLYKMGTKIGVSISTELMDMDGVYEIKILHGVDFTLYPEFDSPIVDANFSLASNQSFEADYPVESPNLVYGDCSLKDYIRESTYPPYRILKDRINEAVNYVKFSREKVVYSNKKFIKSYISSYIKRFAGECMRPDTNINIALGLRLDEYVKDRSVVRELNMALNTAKSEMGYNKAMTPSTQKRLNEAYSKLMTEIYDYIESKANRKKIDMKDGE